MKKITVIVPVHNGEATIERCLNSIISQSVTDLELLILDDASTDRSPQLIEAWIERHPHLEEGTIRYFRQETRMQTDAIRDLAIYNATGKYFMFVEQADSIGPYLLDEYLSEAEKNQVDIVVGGYEETDKSGATIRSIILEDAPFGKLRNIQAFAHLYRREFVMDNRILFSQTNSGKRVNECEAYFTIVAYSATALIRTIQSISYKHTMLPSDYLGISSSNNPVGFLNESYKDLKSAIFRDDEEVEYFYMRYIALYLLHFAPYSEKTNIRKLYKTTMKWMTSRYPTWRRNRYRFFEMPPGEAYELHKVVQKFMILDTLKIQKFLLTLKGKK